MISEYSFNEYPGWETVHSEIILHIQLELSESETCIYTKPSDASECGPFRGNKYLLELFNAVCKMQTNEKNYIAVFFR